MRNARQTISLATVGLFMMANQGCAKSNFSESSKGTAVAASSTDDQTQSPADQPPDVAGDINFKDIAEIDFKAKLNTPLHETALVSVTKLDMDAKKFKNMTDLYTPLSSGPLTECSVYGSNLDFTNLEKNMKSIKLSSTNDPQSFFPDVGSVSLTIILKDGTKKELELDTSTRSVSVTGVNPPKFSAPKLIRQLLDLSLRTRCSVNINY